MADDAKNEQLEVRPEQGPEPDPIADRSLSGPLLVGSLILMLTLVWSLYDELFGQRPWRVYQEDYADRYTAFLRRAQRPQAEAEREIKESAEYQALDQAYNEAREAAAPKLQEIDARLRRIDQQVADITPQFQDLRAWIAARNYALETTSSESSRASIRQEIEERKREQLEVRVTNDDGTPEDRLMDFYALEELNNRLRDEKAKLTAERIELTKPADEARRKRDAYLQDQMTGLPAQTLADLERNMQNFEVRIRQIHVAEGNLVDRCESCHVGIRSPVRLTRAAMGGEGVFVSHPNPDLLKIHDPERFGCSTCHGGNGRATVSVEKAHGRYKHWLWPLYYKENVQAGCNSCHSRDRITPMADVLNRGKDLFQNRGCYACHRYEGFDRETDALSNARNSIKNLEMEREARLREIRAERQAANDAESDDVARQHIRRIDELRQMIAGIDTRIKEYDLQSKYLMQDVKKFGPNLKEIKAKLRKEWLLPWLEDPQAFRPGSKMPKFRLSEDEFKAVAAFLWQSALDVKLPPQPAGDAARGKELFKTVGCLACHSIDGSRIDMGSGRIGGEFAADLSRVGEKANYEYLVRWVFNPRQRLAPYSPSLKRDLTPADYQKKNLPFIFDDEHSKSPVDGRELLVHNMTVMPNFRLTEQEARDVATFLMTLKGDGFYRDAAFLDDTSLKDKGERLVRMYGCASCHEIKGLEEEQRIGTELTVEGSKPIERLDFALLTHDAQHGIDPATGKEGGRPWYNHKGFFENKLRDPAIYDRGKEKAPEERLRMPNIYLTEDDITALTTFLLGSTESALPQSMRYNPTGQKKQAQEGWWVVQKYNCAGCHNVLIGQDSVLQNLPMYQGADGKEQLPPRLTSEGARVNPDWLLGFLRDPSLSREQQVRAALATHMSGGPNGGGRNGGQNGGQAAGASLGQQWGLNRNGVRSYLRVRMPTFDFSPNELQALVNFFMGASSQPQPYIAERLEPLTPQEQDMARALFTSNAAPCLKCHMTGDPAHDSRATAPNFLIAAGRLKPGWTERWLLDPQLISPGTSMPSELFKRDEAHDRWVFNGPTPPSFATYDKDHVALLVRYMFQLNPEEQRRLLAAGGQSGAAAPPATTAGRARKRRRGEVARLPGFEPTRAP